MRIFESFKNDFVSKFHHPADFDPGTPIVEAGENNEGDENIEPIVDDDNNNENEDDDKENKGNEDGLEEIEEITDGDDEDLDENGKSKSKPKEKEDDKNKDEDNKVPTLKAVKTKYPKIFQEFPELRANFFFAKQAKEHFTSVEEMKEARTVVDNFSQIQGEIAQGDPQSVVEFLKENSKDGKATVKFGREFIKSLDENPKVMGAILAPTFINILNEAKVAGANRGDKNLEASVHHITKYLFNNDGEIPKLPNEENNEPKAGEQTEAQKILAQKGKEFFEDVTAETKREFETIVENSTASLRKAKVKPAVINAINNAIIAKINQQLAGDKAHGNNMGSLWKAAQTKGFPLSMRASLKSAMLDAVKNVLPNVRSEVLKENGYKMRKAQSNNNGNSDVNINKKANNSEAGKGGKQPTADELKKSGKSDLEILNILAK